jgi:heterodisulfide reductase subunit B2
MATTAKESNRALIQVCRKLGFELVELDDWNCCGSSSTHSIDAELAFHLACRNLSLAPIDRPLLIACPSCLLRLKLAQIRLKEQSEDRRQYQRLWRKPPPTDLEILHFFELLSGTIALKPGNKNSTPLNGLRFAPYYGCMLARPPALRSEKAYHGLLEKTLAGCGAEAVRWANASKCCGTFLSVAKPAVVTPMVNDIILNAMNCGAECIVTACAMCHLNLEIRCALKDKIPIFHFSELLAISLGVDLEHSWLSRHLVNPVPLLAAKGLL